MNGKVEARELSPLRVKQLFDDVFFHFQKRMLQLLSKIQSVQDEHAYKENLQKISEIFFRDQIWILDQEKILEIKRELEKKQGSAIPDEQIENFWKEFPNELQKMVKWLRHFPDKTKIKTSENNKYLQVEFVLPGYAQKLWIEKEPFAMRTILSSTENFNLKLKKKLKSVFVFLAEQHHKLIRIKNSIPKSSRQEVKLLQHFLQELQERQKQMLESFNEMQNQSWQMILPTLAESIWVSRLLKIQEYQNQFKELEKILKKVFPQLLQELKNQTPSEKTVLMLEGETDLTGVANELSDTIDQLKNMSGDEMDQLLRESSAFEKNFKSKPA